MTSPLSSIVARLAVRSPVVLAAAPLLLLAAGAAQAQYKVIGADGKVTYTDREPTPPTAASAPLGARGGRGSRPSRTCRSSCARSRRSTR